MDGKFEARVCLNGIIEKCKYFRDESEFKKEDNFCYHSGNMNDGGESVTRRIGLEWEAFNSMSSMLCGKRHTWNIKGKIYRTWVRPVMTYGSKT